MSRSGDSAPWRWWASRGEADCAVARPATRPAAYLAAEAEGSGLWDGFRNHAAGDSYRELVERLVSVQHGLCGYCEIDIREDDRQVEHVIPQSAPLGGAAGALDHANMMACCKGGTLQTGDETRRLDPVRRNRSCGEAKGGRTDPDFIDPRTLPALPSLMRVGFDGEVAADEAACADAAVDPGKVNRTIAMLGLNAERLRRARENRWTALNDSWASDFDDPAVMDAAARGDLLQDADNRLPRFFTTSRSWFGAYAETVLSQPPQDWI